MTSEKRYARGYVLLGAGDCDPPHGLGIRDEAKVHRLYCAFAREGWDPNEPAAVGYALNGRVQLLTATHRHEASRRAGTNMPVRLHLRSVVEAAWGTPKWADLIEDVPVKDLEYIEIPEGREPPGLDERVDLTRDLVRE